MQNKPFDVIVFDLGNVLLPFDYTPAVDKLNSVEPDLGTKFLNFAKQNYHVHRDFEAGKIPEPEFIEIMLTALEHKVDEVTFCKLYSEIFTENSGVSSLLPKLKENYQLVLLSNTNSIHREYGWKDFSFLDYFDKLILSHEVKAVKPQKAIYSAVEDFTRKPASRHIFIDDVFEYVLGAKSCGWDGIWFENADKLKFELVKREIL